MSLFHPSSRKYTYEELCEKIAAIKIDITTLQTKVNMIETDVSNLRGRINRKLGGEIPTKETKKDISESVFLTPDGNFI